jgi:hypothetical protein
MNINIIVVALLTTIIGFYSWKSFFRKEDFVPSELPWTQISTSKPRSFVNKTRDAGLHIERVRRSAIIKNDNPVFSFKGSTNGSLEYYFISGVLTEGRPPKDICPPDPEAVVWSNGDADDQICDNVDAGGAFGGYDVVDFGGATGNDCDV